MRNKKAIFDVRNCGLVIIAIAISFLLGEVLLRFIFKPIDYLMPYLETSDVLQTVIRPGSAGHDQNGFRNRFVPQKSEIVVIGDSQTYGTNARHQYNWPSVLSREINMDVYNMSLPGYDPVKYRYLLQTKGVSFNPKIVVVAFYTGNDLYESYKTVYSVDYFKDLRKPGFGRNAVWDKEDILEMNTLKNRFMGEFRDWLAHHSVSYRLLTRFLGDMYRSKEAKNFAEKRNNDIYYFSEDPDRKTGFSLQHRLRKVDLLEPQIKEGLRICLSEFTKMQELCLKNDIKLLILLIPSKELVYKGLFDEQESQAIPEKLQAIWGNESKIFEIAENYFRENRMDFVSSLPLLRQALKREQIFYKGMDDHPNEKGYRLIAKTVVDYLKLRLNVSEK